MWFCRLFKYLLNLLLLPTGEPSFSSKLFFKSSRQLKWNALASLNCYELTPLYFVPLDHQQQVEAQRNLIYSANAVTAIYRGLDFEGKAKELSNWQLSRHLWPLSNCCTLRSPFRLFLLLFFVFIFQPGMVGEDDGVSCGSDGSGIINLGDYVCGCINEF